MSGPKRDGDPPIPDLGIPDLDLAPPPPRASVSRAPAAPAARPAPTAAPHSPQDPFGAGGLDADDFDAGPAAPGGGGIALDYLGSTRFDDDDFDLDGRLEIGVAAGGFAAATQVVADAQSWPTGTSPDPERVRVDSIEIELLAGYGKAPTAIYLAPLYALRVFQRSRALKPLLQESAARLDEAERRREQVLVEVVQTHWAAIDQSERLQKLLEPVKRIDDLAKERQTALASTNAEYAGHVGVLDARLAGLAEEQRRLEAATAACEKIVAERGELFKRADVRQKRVYIELRSARDVAAQATPPGGAPPPEHAAHMAALEQKAQAMQPEVDRLKQELEAARADLAAARAQVSQAERSVRQVQAERSALAEHFQKQIDVRHRGVSDAAAERDKALADAGRAALATRAVPLSEADLERIRTADAQVEALVKENVKYLRALDAYDREVNKRGISVAGALVGVVLLLIVLAVVL